MDSAASAAASSSSSSSSSASSALSRINARGALADADAVWRSSGRIEDALPLWEGVVSQAVEEGDVAAFVCASRSLCTSLRFLRRADEAANAAGAALAACAPLLATLSASARLAGGGERAARAAELLDQLAPMTVWLAREAAYASDGRLRDVALRHLDAMGRALHVAPAAEDAAERAHAAAQAGEEGGGEEEGEEEGEELPFPLLTEPAPRPPADVVVYLPSPWDGVAAGAKRLRDDGEGGEVDEGGEEEGEDGEAISSMGESGDEDRSD
jgi:hypothetical protein